MRTHPRCIKVPMWGLALSVAVLGCGGDDAGSDAGVDAAVIVPALPAAQTVGIQHVILPEISVSPALLVAGDPKLDAFSEWPLIFDVATCTVLWDATLDDETIVRPGLYEVHAAITRNDRVVAESQAQIEVLRLGIRRIQLRGEGRVPLLYRAVDGVRGSFYEINEGRVPWRLGVDASEDEAAVPLELADGTPRPLPGHWDSLTSPPLDEGSADGVESDSYNFPTAWVAGSTVEFIVTFASGVAGAPEVGEPQGVDVRLVIPELYRRAGSAPTFRDGQTMILQSMESQVPNVGRYDLELVWGFEVRGSVDDAWVQMPGQITTTHRLYGLVSRPLFDETRVPHRAWVDVVDQVADWVGGATADADEVGGYIVEGVYETLGLEYDRRRGASFYTRYTASGYGGAVFDLSRFQERENGSTINCTDAASIVSAFSNMMGIDLRYHIIRHNTRGGFNLNYLQGIGSPEFTYSPFLSGNAAFSYHAIVGGPLTSYSVFDATLAVDGDGTPSAPPHTQLLVQGMVPAEYLEALSPDHENVRVFQDQKVTIQ